MSLVVSHLKASSSWDTHPAEIHHENGTQHPSPSRRPPFGQPQNSDLDRKSDLLMATSPGDHPSSPKNSETLQKKIITYRFML